MAKAWGVGLSAVLVEGFRTVCTAILLLKIFYTELFFQSFTTASNLFLPASGPFSYLSRKECPPRT